MAGQEAAPLYLPFFQTTYGNSFGYTERAKKNARVFENRDMHPTFRGSYKLSDLSGDKISAPLKSSYNASIKVAAWPKPKPTHKLPPSSPGQGPAGLSLTGSSQVSFSSTNASGSGSGGLSATQPVAAKAGKSAPVQEAYPEPDYDSQPEQQFSSSQRLSSPPPVAAARPSSASLSACSNSNASASGDFTGSGSGSGGVTFSDSKHSFSSSKRPASASTHTRTLPKAPTQTQTQALSGMLTAEDLKKLAYYRAKFGADVTFHSTRRPQLHHHQQTVMVKSRVRPDDDPLNVYRLEAEANWDKWSISRFHRGLKGRTPGYTGYVPRIQFINGETYGRATRMAFGGARDDGARPVTPASKNGLVRSVNGINNTSAGVGAAVGGSNPNATAQLLKVDYDPLVRTG